MSAEIRVVIKAVTDQFNKAIEQANQKIQEMKSKLSPKEAFEGYKPGDIYTFTPPNMDEFLGKSRKEMAGYNGSIDKLNEKHEMAKQLLDNLNLSSEATAKIMDSLSKVYLKDASAITGKTFPAFKMLEEAFKDSGVKGGILGKETDQLSGEVEDAGKGVNTLSQRLTKFGQKTINGAKSLQWFGFRLMMVGRMFDRMFIGNIQKLLGMFKEWDKSLLNLASGMAALAMSGLLTSEMQEDMIENMMDMVTTGTLVEGIFASLENLFATIGNDVIPILGPAFVTLINTIQDEWEKAWPKIKPTVEEIRGIINEIVYVLEQKGAETIVSFFDGVKNGLGYLSSMINSVKDGLPSFAYWLGVLVALAPVLTVVGLAVFLLSVALTIILAPLKFVWALLGMVGAVGNGEASAGLTTVTAGFIKLLPWLIVIIYFLLALYKWWDELAQFWSVIVGGVLADLNDSINELGRSLGFASGEMDLLKIITAPAAGWLMFLELCIAAVIKVVDLLVDGLRMLIDSFKYFVDNTVVGAIKGFLELLGVIKKTDDAIEEIVPEGTTGPPKPRTGLYDDDEFVKKLEQYKAKTVPVPKWLTEGFQSESVYDNYINSLKEAAKNGDKLAADTLSRITNTSVKAGTKAANAVASGFSNASIGDAFDQTINDVNKKTSTSLDNLDLSGLTKKVSEIKIDTDAAMGDSTKNTETFIATLEKLDKYKFVDFKQTLSDIKTDVDDKFPAITKGVGTNIESMTGSISDNTEKWEIAFEKALTKMTEVMEEFTESMKTEIGNLIASIDSLIDKLNEMYTVNPPVMPDYTQGATATASLFNNGVNYDNYATVQPPSQSTPQQTNYIEVAFNNPQISSNIDINTLVDETSRRLASRINTVRVY